MLSVNKCAWSWDEIDDMDEMDSAIDDGDNGFRLKPFNTKHSDDSEDSDVDKKKMVSVEILACKILRKILDIPKK